MPRWSDSTPESRKLQLTNANTARRSALRCYCGAVTMTRAKKRHYDCCKKNLCDATIVISPEVRLLIQEAVVIDVE